MRLQARPPDQDQDPGQGQGRDKVITVATWNTQWAPVRRRPQIRAQLQATMADILVVTESVAEVLPSEGGVVPGGPDWGYSATSDRRKVLLWSAGPISDVRLFEDLSLPPGRLVTATCGTPIGPVWVVGVCIPWRDAHVRTGRQDAKPWQQHMAFLENLPVVLEQAPPGLPVILAGDWNQRIPARRAPVAVTRALTAALGDLEVATSWPVAELTKPGVCHIASTLPAIHVDGSPITGTDAAALSDHDLVRATLGSPERRSAVDPFASKAAAEFLASAVATPGTEVIPLVTRNGTTLVTNEHAVAAFGEGEFWRAAGAKDPGRWWVVLVDGELSRLVDARTAMSHRTDGTALALSSGMG